MKNNLKTNIHRFSILPALRSASSLVFHDFFVANCKFAGCLDE